MAVFEDGSGVVADWAARVGFGFLPPRMNLPTLTRALLLPAMSLVSLAAEFPAPDQLPAQAGYPDPLTTLAGKKITTYEEWRTQRVPELRELFQHYMYGRRPVVNTPVSGKVLREDKAALGGKATLTEVLVDIGVGEPVHLMIVVPNKPREGTKSACFLGINFSGNYALVDDPQVQMPKGWVYERYAGGKSTAASDAARGSQKDAWAIEQSIDRGYAVATFYNGDVIPDKIELAQERLKAYLPPGVKETDGDAPATIMVWSWAFSRLMDYLVTDPRIDATRVAVVGHSRNGKTALLAAAFDERFALVIPSQAGCGGTAPSRVSAELAAPQANGRPTVETLPVINKSFPHWFSGNFKAFNAAPEKLPFDQHLLIAMCAPRPVLLSNATEDVWANPAGQFEMLKAAEPAYALREKGALGATQMPEVNKLLPSRLGYFIRPGKHAMTTPDWKEWLDFADRWLK